MAFKRSFDRVKPKKASVEFGVEVGIESGALSALICKGTGTANLRVVLEWSSDERHEPPNLPEDSDLKSLLRRCCVVVHGRGSGTGFFIAPGLVVTCADIIDTSLNDGDTCGEVLWDKQTDAAAKIVFTDKANDIALISVAISRHPCVLIGTEVKDERRINCVRISGSRQVIW